MGSNWTLSDKQNILHLLHSTGADDMDWLHPHLLGHMALSQFPSAASQLTVFLILLCIYCMAGDGYW